MSREKETAMATKTIRRHGRCKRCKELVLDPDNCANCSNMNPLGLSLRTLEVSKVNPWPDEDA
jgi:hypothetical protein